MLEMP